MHVPDNAVAALAKDAGVSDSQIPTAVAVALAESGGDSSQESHNSNGTSDHGLWQINDTHLGHDVPYDAKTILDPINNAHAMASISAHGTNWQPWTTYTSGKYQQYMSRGNKAAKDIPGGARWVINNVKGFGSNTFGIPSIPDITGALAAPFKSIADTLGFLFSKQFFYIIGGSVVLLMAVLMIYRSTALPKGIK